MTNLQKAMQEAVEKAQKEALEKQKNEYIDLLIRVQAGGFEKAIAYANVIILAGYAGAFALLSVTQKFIPDKLLITSVILLAFSLVIFCGWEVGKMIFYARHNRKIIPLLNKKLSPEKFFNEMENLQLQENLSNIKMGKWWYFILVLTVIPGFSAGGMLLYSYIVFLANGAN